MQSAFALFDEIDAWLRSNMEDAMEWIDSGLDVRSDAEFIREISQSQKAAGGIARMIKYHEFLVDQAINMDC